jgi:hypothetical protein
MAIKKQEFYEGAALHRLACVGGIESIQYEAPFFVVNNNLLLYLKYSTKGRSPWAFTFTTEEQVILQGRAAQSRVVIGLICGADGVVALTHEGYVSVATSRRGAVHIACYRRHGQHYEVSGPAGTLARKVAPGHWTKILDGEDI